MSYNHCNHSLSWCHNTSSFIFCFKFFSLSTITLVSLGGSSGGMIQTHIAQSYQSLVIIPFSGWDGYTSAYSHSYNGARKCQKSPRQITYVLHIFLLDAIMTPLVFCGFLDKKIQKYPVVAIACISIISLTPSLAGAGLTLGNCRYSTKSFTVSLRLIVHDFILLQLLGFKTHKIFLLGTQHHIVVSYLMHTPHYSRVFFPSFSSDVL